MLYACLRLGYKSTVVKIGVCYNLGLLKELSGTSEVLWTLSFWSQKTCLGRTEGA